METQKLTAFETLDVLIPEILNWRSDARFFGFHLNNYPEPVPLDGKDTNWRIAVFSLRSNKVGDFQIGKPIYTSSASFIPRNLDFTFKIKDKMLHQFYDSHIAIQKAKEVGVPIGMLNHDNLKLAGSAEWTQNRLLWWFTYTRKMQTTLEKWVLQIDMISGEIVSHRPSKEKTGH